MDPSENQMITQLIKWLTERRITIPKTIIDIGANDGVILSNSYLLCHELDFSGFLIEPNPKLVSCLKYLYGPEKYFMKVQIECFAISDSIGLVKLFGHPNDDREIYDHEIIIGEMGASLKDQGGKKSWWTLSIDMPTFLKLKEITSVGVFSVDTEGHDIIILKSLFGTDLRPSVIITEVDKNPLTEWEKHQLILSQQYECIIEYKSNRIYYRIG